MSEYIKTTWQNGDVITAEKLNNMENGIANNSSGGSGGGGKRVIEIANSGAIETFTIEENLSDEDLLNIAIRIPLAGLFPAINIQYTYNDEDSLKITGIMNYFVKYQRSTGELTVEPPYDDES